MAMCANSPLCYCSHHDNGINDPCSGSNHDHLMMEYQAFFQANSIESLTKSCHLDRPSIRCSDITATAVVEISWFRNLPSSKNVPTDLPTSPDLPAPTHILHTEEHDYVVDQQEEQEEQEQLEASSSSIPLLDVLDFSFNNNENAVSLLTCDYYIFQEDDDDDEHPSTSEDAYTSSILTSWANRSSYVSAGSSMPTGANSIDVFEDDESTVGESGNTLSLSSKAHASSRRTSLETMSSHERRLWQEYQIDDMLSVADDDDDEDSIANNIASLGRAPMQRMASRGMDSLAVGVGRDMASYFGSDDDGVLDDPKDEDDMPPLYAIVLPPLEPHEDSHATLFTCDASFQDLQPELPLLRRGATTDDSDGADQPSLPLPDLSTFMLVVDNAAGASENARASAPQSTGKLPNRSSSTDTTATAVR